MSAVTPLRLVVTGSSSGIGRALVTRLIANGHSAWGLARSDQTDLVASLGNKFNASRCDVSVWAEVEAVAKEVARTWPDINGIVTCAGLHGEVGPALATDPTGWSNTVRANLDGTYYALRAFASLLGQTVNRAKAVCFSGGGATAVRQNFSAYAVAKTGIVRLVETIAAEEHSRPLDINAIAPGAINTRLTDEILKLGPKIVGEAEYQTACKLKAGGNASLERALDLVEWLLSPASNGISGRLISAPWDPWPDLNTVKDQLEKTDIYTLRRITPQDRGENWGRATAN